MYIYTLANIYYICVLLTKSNILHPTECVYKWFARQINFLFTDTQLLPITE